MRITVIGAGYVGLVTSACLAEWGHDVVCVDIDQQRGEGSCRGEVPIFEPGLDDLVAGGIAANRLSFTTDYAGPRWVSVPSPSFPESEE